MRRSVQVSPLYVNT